jgi:hypothetical protein
MNSKIIKKLGEGFEGDVFLVKEGKELQIMKIMKIPENDISPNIKYPLWREFEFAKFSKNYPTFFMQLKSFTIEMECEFKKKTPGWLYNDKDQHKEFKKRQSSHYCAVLKYEPLLRGTLGVLYMNINNKYLPRINRETWQFPANYYKISYGILLQQLYILYLLLENDWIHRDAHIFNWMYKENRGKIKLVGLDKSYNITCPFMIVLCDYGMVTHKTFPEDDKKSFDREKYKDIIACLINAPYDEDPYEIFKGNHSEVKKFKARLKEHPLASKIKFRKIEHEKSNTNILTILFRMRYPEVYAQLSEISGYEKKIVHHNEKDIEIMEFLFNNYHKPYDVLDYIRRKIE